VNGVVGIQGAGKVRLPPAPSTGSGHMETMMAIRETVADNEDPLRVNQQFETEESRRVIMTIDHSVVMPPSTRNKLPVA
jgi:hypothetical protein